MSADLESVAESRSQRRFNVTKPISAVLGATPVDIINLGGGGMLIEHSDPMKIGTAGQMTIELAGEGTIIVSVTITWSRLSRRTDATGKFRYRTGVCIVSKAPEVIGALGRLIRATASPDSGSLERKREAIAQKRHTFQSRHTTPVAPPPVIRPSLPIPSCFDAVCEAQTFLATHREEAAKWHSRARYSLAAEQGFRSATPPSQHVLAIWEYLGGKVDLGEIVATVDILNDLACED